MIGLTLFAALARLRKVKEMKMREIMNLVEGDDMGDLGTPLPGKEEGFHAVKQAMANAESTKSGSVEFWMVDLSAPSLTDAVAKCSVTYIGNFAIGSPNWKEHSKHIRLFPVNDSYSLRDVFEALFSMHEKGVPLI